MISPRSIAYRRSATLVALARFDSAISTEIFISLIFRTASISRVTTTGARPSKGSSSRRMAGESIIARAMATILVLPAPLRPTRTTDSLSPTSREPCRRICARPRYVLMACSSSMGGPEHCVLHRLVAADLLGAASGENHALVHDHDPIRVLEDDVHVVLDDHGGDPLRPDDRADHVHDRRLLAGADAAGRLVEEQELRLERVGDGHVEQLPLSLRDAARQLLRLQVEAELPEDVVRFLPDGGVVIGEGEEPARLSFAGQDGQRDVVDDGQLVEEVDDLEAARDARLDPVLHRLTGDVLAAKDDTAAVRLEKPAGHAP